MKETNKSTPRKHTCKFVFWETQLACIGTAPEFISPWSHFCHSISSKSKSSSLIVSYMSAVKSGGWNVAVNDNRRPSVNQSLLTEQVIQMSKFSPNALPSIFSRGMSSSGSWERVLLAIKSPSSKTIISLRQKEEKESKLVWQLNLSQNYWKLIQWDRRHNSLIVI